MPPAEPFDTYGSRDGLQLALRGEPVKTVCVTAPPGYPDIDALYKQQALETDRKKREVMLHQIQPFLNERVRFAHIFEYVWPSGIGPGSRSLP